MTRVTHEFTDRCCHTTHLPTSTSSPQQPSNTTLAPKHKLDVHFIGFGVGLMFFSG
jgi:hypothetical protein